MKKSVIILGSGISGLAAAHHFETQARVEVDYRIVESSSRPGGKIHSIREDGFLVESGPDSFMARKPAILTLCRALGLEDQLIESSPGSIFVWTDGRLVAMPPGLMMMAPTKLRPFLKSRLISWPGKIRMGLEPLIPPGTGDEDESLAGFVRRRFGQEALDKIAGPLFGGIHAGDPEQLSLRSTFPLFAEMERSHGSLIRAMFAQRTRRKPSAVTGAAGAAPGMWTRFLSLRGGMQTLVDAIVAQLPPGAILSGERAVSVARQRPEQQFEITLQNGRRLFADQVLFTTPAYVTADLLEGLDSKLAEQLRAIPYASTATVSLGFRAGDLAAPLNGNGFIVSHREKRRITACTWSSSKFTHRAPSGAVLLRVFLGSARIPDLSELPDEELIRIALQELKVTMQVSAAPILAKAYRWPRAIPQYEVGHAGRVREIERLMAFHPGLHLAGAAYHGSGIPDCVQSGSENAIRILERLADGATEASLCAAGREKT